MHFKRERENVNVRSKRMGDFVVRWYDKCFAEDCLTILSWNVVDEISLYSLR